MTTPHERLARMRKSFERNRSVLTEDYKYFITRMVKPRAEKPASARDPSKCQSTR